MQLNKIIMETIDLFKALKIEKYIELELDDEFEPSNKAGSSSYQTCNFQIFLFFYFFIFYNTKINITSHT